MMREFPGFPSPLKFYWNVLSETVMASALSQKMSKTLLIGKIHAQKM